MRLHALLYLCFSATACPVCLWAQLEPTDRHTFRNAIAVGGEWSNTSSHIFLGIARRRRLGAVDLTASHRWLDHRRLTWYNDTELQPLFFLEDPTVRIHTTFKFLNGHSPTYLHTIPPTPLIERCRSVATSYTNPQRTFTSTFTQTCGTRWTYGGGVSPLGQRFQFLPTHRAQPYVVVNPGFIASPRDIPLPKTSSLNFTFDVGVGVAWHQSAHRSIAVDYRYHHLSNAYLGPDPGVDNQVVHVTYTFGR